MLLGVGGRFVKSKGQGIQWWGKALGVQGGVGILVKYSPVEKCRSFRGLKKYSGGLSLSVSVYIPYVGFNTPYITTLHFLANK